MDGRGRRLGGVEMEGMGVEIGFGLWWVERWWMVVVRWCGEMLG